MKQKLTDLKTILWNGVVAGAGQFIGIALRFIYTVVCTRFLGSSLYGLFVLGRSVIQMAALFGQFGMGMAVQRQVAFYIGKNDKEKIGQSIRLALMFSVMMGIFVFVLINVLSKTIATYIFNKEELDAAVRMLSLSIPAIVLLQVFYNIFQGLKKISIRVFLEYLLFHLFNILLLVVLFGAGLKLAGVVWAFILTNILTLCAAIFLFARTNILPSNLKVDLATCKEQFSYALPMFFASALHFLQRWTDTLMLGIMSTSAAVGIYNVSLRLGALVATPLVAFNMIFSPLIGNIYAENDIRRLEYNYQIVTKLIFTFSLYLFLIVVLFPKELLVVFGREFEAVSAVLIVICFGQLINASVGSTGYMLVMTGHQNINLINSVIFLILCISLNYFLIPRYGVLGAGIANAISLGFLNFVRVVQIYIYMKIQPFGWNYFKPILSFTITFVSVLVLKRYIHIVPFSFIAFIICLSVEYFLIMYFLGLTSEERAVLFQLKNKFIKSRPPQ